MRNDVSFRFVPNIFHGSSLLQVLGIDHHDKKKKLGFDVAVVVDWDGMNFPCLFRWRFLFPLAIGPTPVRWNFSQDPGLAMIPGQLRNTPSYNATSK
jgi:hypothetical protein